MIQRRIHETQIGLNRIVGFEIIQIHLRYFLSYALCAYIKICSVLYINDTIEREDQVLV